MEIIVLDDVNKYEMVFVFCVDNGFIQKYNNISAPFVQILVWSQMVDNNVDIKISAHDAFLE